MIYGFFAGVRARADLEELKPYQAALNISMQRDHMYSFSKQTYHFYNATTTKIEPTYLKVDEVTTNVSLLMELSPKSTSLIVMFVEKYINIKISRACLVAHHQGLHGQLHLPANQMPQNILGSVCEAQRIPLRKGAARMWS
jgi:hypothetical protein